MRVTSSSRGIAAIPTLAILLILALVIFGAMHLTGRDQGNTNVTVTNSNANTAPSIANVVPANQNNRANDNASPAENTNNDITTNNGGNLNLEVNANSAPDSNTAIPADWHTYRDPNDRLSFRYPSDWMLTADPTSDSVSVKPQEFQEYFELVRFLPRSLSDPIAWLNEHMTDPRYPFTVTGTKRVVLGAERAIYFNGNSTSYVSVSLARSVLLVRIPYERFPEKGTFDRIIASMAFVGTQQSYTDSVFGFSFSYPTAWALSTYPNGTISIAPRTFQEPIPVIKALTGNERDATTWVEQAWLDSAAGVLQRTDRTFSFANMSGTIYELNGRDYVAIANLATYAIAVSMVVTREDQRFSDYHNDYLAILKSLTQQ